MTARSTSPQGASPKKNFPNGNPTTESAEADSVE